MRRTAQSAALRNAATVGHIDERFGVPRFVWATPSSRAAGSAALRGTSEQSARSHVARLGALYGLDDADVRDLELRHVHDTGRGGIVATFARRFDGVEVFRDELKVMMNRDHTLLAASGFVPGRAITARGDRRFGLSADAAVRTALGDFAGVSPGAAAIESRGSAAGGFVRFQALGGLPAGLTPTEPIRAKKVWFHMPDELVPAYYVELLAQDAAYSYVVSARDGAVLFRHDLVAADAYTYRVWANTTGEKRPQDSPTGDGPTPHPTGTPNTYDPPFVAPSLLTLQNGPISTGDAWLPPGATETTGNNVDAYADLVAPDGFSAGDLRASTTAPNTFDRTYDVTQSPSVSNDQRMAAITQLFYDNNWLHDWYYDAGFNEVSGNAQASNYGRGGIEGDRLRAEAQDYSGTNNANMLTPSDGASPRMQMYVFNQTVSAVTVNAPGSIAGTYAAGTATGFGPQTFDVTANAVLAVDNVAPTSDGCTAYTNSVAGQIAIVDRGNCTFVIKAQQAQAAGAIGVIIVDNAANTVPPGLGGTDGTIVIPVLSVTQAVGNSIKNALLSGAVNLRMLRGPANPSRDGTIDNLIVSHEWGHYISNRLVGNSAGLSTNMARGLGEGWGDFTSMLQAVRSTDNFAGTWSLAGYANSNPVLPNQSYYFGFRRYPYSTDMTKNPLTFRHIQDGVALPVGPPVLFGQNGASNSEVHNTGEVWCAMLWECYASLLNTYSYDVATDRMRGYLVAAYKMTPYSPTLVEARDALLAAAQASSAADRHLFCAAFAKRGAGTGAVAPDRYSSNNVGVTESYACGGDLALVSAELNLSGCDDDAYLDNGESGMLTITLKNVGDSNLSSTSVSLSSTNPAVSFPSGNSSPVAATTPLQTASVSIPVTLSGAVGFSTLDITIQYDDPGLLIAGPRSSPFDPYVNADDAPSTTESVEAYVPWTFDVTPAVPAYGWQVTRMGPANHRFHGPDNGTVSDLRLTTPPLNVAATGSFTFSFQHAHSFEYDGTRWDGGVIELSNNGGASWVDIGASASPTYNGTLVNNSGNPLQNRPAYTATSAGWPNLQTVTVDLGTTYAGQTVQIRFRAGSDGAVGAPGWDIDNVVFNNLTNAPFFQLVPETDICAPTAVLASVVKAEATEGGAHLAWMLSSEASGVQVQRTIEGGEWATVGAAIDRGRGQFEFDDASVTAGQRYGYRLNWTGPTGPIVAGEAWVTIPRTELALAGFRPNPAVGDLKVELALPGDAPAKLELVDVGGRRLAARDVGSLGAGRHVVSLGRAGDVAPGLYWLRLTQAGRTLTRTAVVMK